MIGTTSTRSSTTCDHRVGVAIEIERWGGVDGSPVSFGAIIEVNISAPVILHDNPANLAYVFEHLRLLSVVAVRRLARPVYPALSVW